jgi:uncharacterized Fe-S center protein
MANVLVIKDVSSTKFDETLEKELRGRFKEGMKVAVKLHMGELKGMFSPEIAKRSVAVLKKLGCKPFLFDTVVKYPGPRHFKSGYLAVAAVHGFTAKKMGCPIVISDGYVNVKTDHMNVEVAKELSESDAMLVLSHVKGHPCAGFGGAIKNLAMGCSSIKSKKDQHSLGLPSVIIDSCVGCKICENVCFFGAIKVKDGKAKVNSRFCAGCDSCVLNCPHKALEAKVMFDTLLAEAAWAAIEVLKGKLVYYVNDVRSITKNCDCFPNPGALIASDFGILLSKDLVAIDNASVGVIMKQEGKDVFKEVHHHDPFLAIKEAERLGLGSTRK